MKHQSNKVLKLIKRVTFAAVVLLLLANLFQYFAEPTPPPQLENPKIELLTDEARPGDTISYHITAEKNTNQDAQNKRTLICEVGGGQYTTIALSANPSTKSAPEGPIDAVFFLPLTPVSGDQFPPEAYGQYCYMRNSATYPKIHKQFTLFGLGDYRDADGVDDGFTTYVYDSYNCRDRSGDCDRSQMLKLLPPLDEAQSVDTIGSAEADLPAAVVPKTQTNVVQQEPEISGGDDGDDNTTPQAQQNPVINFLNGVLGGARDVVDGIIRP